MNKKIILITILLFIAPTTCKDVVSENALRKMYEFWCRESSDMRDHIPVLHDLAKQCGSVVEIGLRSMTSTWGILQGLAESKASQRSYVGIDLACPPMNTLQMAKRLTESVGVNFQFIEANDMTIDIAPSDMLFIDSLHTYCHLTYELEKFSPKIRKYICMHDTSEPWGELDDNQYHGDYSEYPAEYDKTKRGLWLAVEDFLKRHPEWTLQERRLNCHGFTILRRINS